MGFAQVPLAWFVVSQLGGSWPVTVVWLLAVNMIIVVRIRHLPQPLPPPLWFERYVIWGYFIYTMTAMYFVPGWLIGVAAGVSDSALTAWVFASFGLSLFANGVPYRHVKVRRVDIQIPGLPQAFSGLTIAQLTDLHIGPFAPESRVHGWVRRVNAQAPDYVFLTGDLIASGSRFVPALERALAQLTPKRGVVAIMGNHDYFPSDAGDALLAMHRRLGHIMLRNEAQVLDEGGDQLVFAGIDDTWRKSDDIDKALADVPDGVPVVLLAHDPETFPKAATFGIALQVSGHLHGGQLAIPFLGVAGSVLRPFPIPYIHGRYRQDRSTMYVSAGLGTTGAPVRIGMPSEIPILRLIP